jgi:hypothetical protein
MKMTLLVLAITAPTFRCFKCHYGYDECSGNLYLHY